MSRYNDITRSAAMIALVAGLALPAVAQMESERPARDQRATQPEQQRRDAQQPERRDDMRQQAQGKKIERLSIVRASDLMGSEIQNAEDNGLGSIDDLLVDRGTGKISHIVVHSGDILGMGGEKVAVPFEAFQYDFAEKQFLLNITADELEDIENTRPSNWVVLDSGDMESQLSALDTSVRTTRSQQKDPYASAFGNQAKSEEIKGTVIGVNRVNGPDGTEYVSVELDQSGANRDATDRDAANPDRANQPANREGANQGNTRTVILGPSWYVMGNDNAPMRGQTVTLKAVPHSGAGSQYIASGYAVDGKNMELRGQDGRAMWNNDSRNRSLVQLSEIIGRDAHARTEDSGEIQDALVEGQSGVVAMLIFDPNENVLGIGDDLKCVPWTEASIGSEVVRIDADVDMLKSCPSSPEDLTNLTTPESLRPMYEPFGAEVAQFHARESYGWNGQSRSTRSTERQGG